MMTSRMTRMVSLSPARRYSLSLSLSEPCGASCSTSDRGSRHKASRGTMWSCCKDSKMPTSLRAFRYESHMFFSGSLFHFWFSNCDKYNKKLRLIGPGTSAWWWHNDALTILRYWQPTPTISNAGTRPNVHIAMLWIKSGASGVLLPSQQGQ